MKKLLIAITVVLILPIRTWSQVTVVQAPVPKFRSFTPAGLPNVGGCVYTFASGTSTPQATYFDFTGLVANSNPVILDANGEAPIWITGSVYRFQVWSFGSGVIGSNCGNGTQLYQIDGIRDTGLSAFTSGPIVIAPTSNGIDILAEIRATDISASGNFLNFKSFAGSTLFKVDINGNVTGGSFNKVTITAPATGSTLTIADGKTVTINNGLTFVGTDGTTQTFQASDTIVGRATTDTLSNKTLTSPAFGGTATGIASFPVTLLNSGINASNATFWRGDGTWAGLAPFSFNQTGLTGNAAGTLTTPAASGFYRFSCYVVLISPAGTSSTLPSCQYSYTDADSNTAETVIILNTSTANTAGTIGAAAAVTNTFLAKAGVAINYATASYASNPAAAMTYALHVRLEGPF